MPREKRRTEQQWRDLDNLRKHWSMWCDRDAFEGSDTFIDDMEAAGYAHTRPVTRADLAKPFAFDRGIEKGSVLWELTKKGRTALNSLSSLTPATESKK